MSRRLAAALLLACLGAGCGEAPEVDQARQLLDEGKGWDAAAALAPLLDRETASVEAHRLYVEALLLDGQTLAAAAAYERMARRSGERPPLLGRIARLVLQGAAGSHVVGERLAAAEEAAIAGRAGLELIEGLLDDPQPRVALAAAVGLARAGDRAGLDRLKVRVAGDGPWTLRAQALERLTAAAAVDEQRAGLQAALASSSRPLRLVAARLAAEHGLAAELLGGSSVAGGGEIAELARAAGGGADDATALRRWLVGVLEGRLRTRARPDLLLAACCSAHPAPADLLAAAVRHADFRVRRVAVRAAIELPDGEERRSLLDAAERDRVAEVAVLAARALSERPSDRHRVRLLRAVSGGDLGGRAAALTALRELGDPRHAALLRRWLAAADPRLKAVAARQAAAAGLAGLISELRPLLLASEPEVRCAGAAAVLALHGS